MVWREEREETTTKRLLDIANVEHSISETEKLNKTVLKKVFEGLKVIKDGSRFAVSFTENYKMKLSFLSMKGCNLQGTGSLHKW